MKLIFYLVILEIKMSFSDLSLEEQQEFWEKQNKLTEKLKSMDKAKLAREILPTPPEIKKKSNPYGSYYKYHKKWQSHPDNWRKIGE